MDEKVQGPSGVSSALHKYESQANFSGQVREVEPLNLASCSNMELDTEGTNCSETMSTNDDEEDYRQATENRSRSKAVSERISSPAHRQKAQLKQLKEEQKSLGETSNFLGDCDDNQQATSSDNSYYLMSTAQLQHNDETPSTGELSELAIANSQAPPSYGSATHPASNCAALDASQLHHLHQLRLAEQTGQQLANNSNYSATRFSSTSSQQHYSSNSGTLVGGIDMVNANANVSRECNSLFGETIAHTMEQQGKQQQYYHQSQSSAANGASDHNGLDALSPATSLANQLLLHKGQRLPSLPGYSDEAENPQLPRLRFIGELPLTNINVAHNTNDLRQHPINLGPDNNQTFAFRQQQHQFFPINHVISERGSLSWQPQTNKYRACVPLPGPSQNGRANPPSVVRIDVGQSCDPRAQGSSWIMDASASGVNSQPTPTNRNGPLQLTDSAANGKGSSQDTGLWHLAQVLHPGSSNPNHNQASNQSKNVLQTQTFSSTSTVPPISNSTSNVNRLLSLLARSHEILPDSSATLGPISGATSRARREQLQSAHYRKRRRHRSTSGRSVSPTETREKLEDDMQVGGTNNFSTSFSHPTAALANRSLSASQTGSLKQRQQAISAHCWLIDSSDDQTYASASKSKQQHLTKAITKQSAQQQQQQLLLKKDGFSQSRPADKHIKEVQKETRERQGKDYGVAITREQVALQSDLTSDLRTNSLRMEKILNKPDTTCRQPRIEVFSADIITNRMQQTLPARFHQQQRRRQRLSSNSSEEPEPGSGNFVGRAVSQNGEQAGTLLRLSTLLSMISNLVKRPRSLRVSHSAQSVPQMPSCTRMNSQPLNSVSGSMTTNGPPYALAVSSSSSTSAYATESSHQSSNGSAGPYRTNYHQHNSDPPILLNQLRKDTRRCSNAGSASIFYSSSGLSSSAIQPSSHAYEYCDQLFSETKFALADNIPPEPEASDERSSSSTAGGTIKSARVQQILPQSLMSDSELISGGSEAGFPAATDETVNNVVSSSTPMAPSVSARRRWRWFSFKNWLKRRTCTEEESAVVSDTGEASRYKALGSSRRIDPPPSLIRNIISLAKADRVFRWRLIASVIVSCILVALVSLLVGLLYIRSNTYQRNKFNLLIDDSDYDLTWLWPANAQHQRQTTSQSDKISEQPLLIDGPLKAHLLTIEQSEHLNQFQLCLAYLTNLQLASDKFIDITQLAYHLAPPPNSSISGLSTASLELNEADQKLVSLVLLSNLHWPLVKWKHQSQQSITSFLSFALAPAPLTGVQTLRNLLAALLLTESLPKIPNDLYPTLSQFLRLNSLLRSSSYHIISCSYWLGLRHTNSQKLRVNFCLRIISKYRRTMRTLSQLDQNQRAKLQDHLDIGLELGQPKLTKNLAGFFLDRLAVLASETIALETVALEDESSIGTSVNHTLEALLGADHPLAVASSEHDGILNRWKTADSLFEMTKLVIGSMVERAEVSKPSEFEFEPLSTESEEFNQLLVKELVYPWNVPRLPPSITPLNYDLFLHPNLTSKLILGMVKIEFQLERRTNFLILHCSKLNLVELSVWMKQISPVIAHTVPSGPTESLKQLPVRRVLTNPNLEQLYIELQEPIDPWTDTNDESQDSHQTTSFNFANELPPRITSRRRNQFLVSISFNKTSLLHSGPEPGLEFVSYGDLYALPEAELKTMMYTQFEPTNARRLFPSLDEPHLKARFQLNLVHEQHHQVLFNAPKRERVPYTSDGFLQMSVFEPVPVPLSTYLIAFVICDVHSIKSITSRSIQLQLNQSFSSAQSNQNQPKHVQVQMLAQFEQLSQAEFASQLVPELLQYYQSLFQFPFPLEKLDLVAIPRESLLLTKSSSSEVLQRSSWRSSQSIDTMENLGLIWFKASLLLADPNLISQNLVEQVAMLISHQLAHQFFGNIVSVRSWQDLWLYEALCQYLESMALSSVEPDWRLEEQFPVSTIRDSLAQDLYEDTLTSSQPEFEVPETADHLAVSARLETNVEALASDQPESLNQLYRKTFNTQDEHSAFSPEELKRSSAILHMLLLNLLPTNEARAQLLRDCLHLFKYSTMSSRQFWFHFGDFLAHPETGSQAEGRDPLTLLKIPEKEQLAGSSVSESLQFELHNQSRTSSSTMGLSTSIELEQQHERTVFVRTSSVSNNGQSELTEDAHKIRIRSTSSSGRKLELVANAWIERQGYPLVTVSAYRDRIHLHQERFSFAWWATEPVGFHSVDSPHLTQEARARRSFRAAPDDVWPIPLLMVSHFNQRVARFFWLDKREMEVSLVEPLSRAPQFPMSSYGEPGYSSSDNRKGSVNFWYKLNVNQTTLTRVNYDERNWEALTELLLKSHYSNHLLSSLDRANLLDDAFTLMRHGRLSLGIAMNLTLYLEVAERDYMPWESALMHLDQMQTLLNQNPLWHRYVLKLIRPISSVIGWKDDGPHLMRKLRRKLFSVALQYGDEKSITKAKQEFKGWQKNGRFIVPNLHELVYVAGVRYGDQQEWFHCWQKYQQLVALDSQNGSTLMSSNYSFSSDGSFHGLKARQTLLSGSPSIISGSSELSEGNTENEKHQLLTALASTQNTWLLEQFLNYSLDPTKIQPQHLKHVMQTLGKNPVARLYLWRFLRLNWITLIHRYIGTEEALLVLDPRVSKPILAIPQENNQILETLIAESTRHFASKLDYEEVKSFFERKLKQLQERLNLELATWNSSIEKAILQSLEIIRSNIYWREYIEPKMTRWLTHYDGENLS